MSPNPPYGTMDVCPDDGGGDIIVTINPPPHTHDTTLLLSLPIRSMGTRKKVLNEEVGYQISHGGSTLQSVSRSPSIQLLLT